MSCYWWTWDYSSVGNWRNEFGVGAVERKLFVNDSHTQLAAISNACCRAEVTSRRRTHAPWRRLSSSPSWLRSSSSSSSMKICRKRRCRLVNSTHETRRFHSRCQQQHSPFLSLSLSLSLSHSVCLGVDYWKSRDDREAEQQLTRRQKQATVT